MSTANRSKKPWDASEYLQVVAAGYDAGELVVHFVDGSEGRIDVERLTRVQARRPDWPALSFNEYEIIVPTAEGDFEISSFAIRSLTDAAFHAHLKAKEAESARRVGQRIQELRRGRDLTVEALAERAGFTPAALSRIEQGDHDGYLPDLQRVVEAMGHGLEDLVIGEDEEPSAVEPSTADAEPSSVPATP